MKSLNSVMALLVGAAILTAGAGCKHNPKPPTLIPGSRSGGIGDGGTPTAPVLPKGTQGLGNNPGGNTPGGPILGSNDPIGGRPLTGNDLNGGSTSTPITPVTPGGAELKGRFDENMDRDESTLKAETVYFELDRAGVRESERPKADRVAAFLKNEVNAKLLIEGNCDERGTEDYNRSLGERRALGVREYLLNAGVAPERVTTTTFGEDKPADAGHDESAWAKNRRADFVILRPKSIQ